MNSIALRHHLKQRAKQKRRIKFSIHPCNQMPNNWTEEQLEAQLTEYVDRSVLIKELNEQHKAQGESIRKHYEANMLSSCGLETHSVNVVSKTKIVYSDKYRREKARIDKQFEEARKKEEENFFDPKYTGPDQCKSIDANPFNHMQVVLRKER